MSRNLLHYNRALFLRRRKGYSYSEIMSEIPVAKSTLSGWLANVKLDVKQQVRIKGKQQERWSRNYNLGEWNRQKRQNEIKNIRIDAKQALGKMTNRELLIAGVMLYWAEGHKGGKDVRISNSDPVFIKVIMHWFRECLGITKDEFRAAIHYHEGQSEDALKKFWSRVADIPAEHFRKGFCKPPGTGHRKHYLQHGTIQIRVCKSADLFHKISGWKDGLIKEAISGKTIQ